MSNEQAPTPWIYFFGAGQAEGGNEVKHLVGGKGASLAEMTRAGLQVPPGFTISTECCRLYDEAGKHWPDGLRTLVQQNLGRLEQLVERRFGQGEQPLLLAVRSGAAQSMPGMMDSILNVGLHPEVVRELARRSGQPRQHWRAYWHFVQMFAQTASHVEEAVAHDLRAVLLSETGKGSEEELSAEELEQLCDRYRSAYRGQTGRDLPTDPQEQLFQAIEAVWGSWHNERAEAYRRHHKIEGLLGTAVNIQMMCPAEIAGVMFTANPVNPDAAQIIIEAVPGLGEALVLGKVTPAHYVLSRPDLQTVEQENQGQPELLTGTQLQELARLGLRVEEYFAVPCDIEWARADGQFYLLQARAISRRKSSAPAFSSAEIEKIRYEEIARVKALATPEGTVWSRFNLAEIVPEPTPMTWSIVRRFMSGRGGYGLMYRDLGFDPDPALDEIGVFDLICGRPYCNLSREPKMQYRLLPFEHPLAELKREPHRAMQPQARFNPSRASWRFWAFLPVLFVKLLWSASRLRQMSLTFAEHFRKDIVPAFVEETAAAAATDWIALEPQQLLERLHHWIQRTLVDFARDSLKPTALADMAMANLERTLIRLRLQKSAGKPAEMAACAEQVRLWLRHKIMGVHPEPDTDLPAAMRELLQGQLDRETFLERFGHRGSEDMELSLPRWGEDPHVLDQWLDRQQAEQRQSPHPRPLSPEYRGEGSNLAPLSPVLQSEGSNLAPLAPVLQSEGSNLSPLSPVLRGEGSGVRGEDTPADLLSQLNLGGPQRLALEQEMQVLHTYLGLRETAKHQLMRGYDLIRRILLELDRRFELDGGIFYLTLEELPELLQGRDFRAVIEQRRKQRALLLSLPIPPVLFSDDLEAIGRPIETISGETVQGLPLSAGVVEGPALVLSHPATPEGVTESYILVCPTTDPAWVPLFLAARGLVMEAGGMLSHGAIAAREFGLPAVAGLPGIHQRLRTGQRLRVDGNTGQVSILN